jgi:hypothetical protein
MRLTLVLLVVLGLALQAAGQLSISNSNSVPASVTNSASNPASSSNSNTNSVSGSISVSASGTGTWTRSGTNSWSPTGSASVTYPRPPTVVGLENFCKGHITNICPAWSDPAGFVFVEYEITISNGTFSNTFRWPNTSVRISNLAPNTNYNITVEGVLANGVRSLPSSISVTTDAADAKIDPALDIRNIACVSAIDPADHNRVEVDCTWTAAATTPSRIAVKVRCVSDIREPLFIRKKFFGARAAVTSYTFHVHRDVATCNIFFRSYYPRRPARRQHLVILVSAP